MSTNESKLEELLKRLADLKARWPKHSVPMAMAIEREELEEEIARLQKIRDEKASNASAE